VVNPWILMTWIPVLVGVAPQQGCWGAVPVVNPWIQGQVGVLAGVVAVANPWVLVLVGVLASRAAGELGLC